MSVGKRDNLSPCDFRSLFDSMDTRLSPLKAGPDRQKRLHSRNPYPLDRDLRRIGWLV